MLRIALAIAIGLCWCDCTLAEPELLGLSAYIMFDTNAYRGKLVGESDRTTARAELRNLKISFASEPFERLRAKLSLEYDGEGGFGVDDAFVQLELTNRFGLIAGHFKEPMGLESNESSRYQLVLERSPATEAFTFGRNYGVNLFGEGKAWRADFAATRVEADDNDFQDSIAYTGRLGARVLSAKRFFVHLGAAVSKRNTPDRRYEIDEPLIAPIAGNSLHSDELRAAELLATSYEFAMRTGPLVVQGETFVHQFNLRGDRGTARFDGYYAAAVWTFFGDEREWDDGWISFEGGKRHTLELAARYTELDLSHNGDGDSGQSTAIALNYYARDRLRLSLEFERGKVQDHDDYEVDIERGQSVNTRIMFAF